MSIVCMLFQGARLVVHSWHLGCALSLYLLTILLSLLISANTFRYCLVIWSRQLTYKLYYIIFLFWWIC